MTRSHCGKEEGGAGPDGPGWVPGLVERYFALTAARHFPNPLVGDLIGKIRERFAVVRA